MTLSILQPKQCFFLPQRGRITSRRTPLTVFLHLTKASRRQISSRHYYLHLIIILSNSSAIKRIVIASFCAEIQSKAKGKQPYTKCHSEPCPEQGRRNSEEPQSYCKGAYAIPRPEQIEKYAPQFVISSIRERSRFLTEPTLSQCDLFETTRKRIFAMTRGAI